MDHESVKLLVAALIAFALISISLPLLALSRWAGKRRVEREAIEKGWKPLRIEPLPFPGLLFRSGGGSTYAIRYEDGAGRQFTAECQIALNGVCWSESVPQDGDCNAQDALLRKLRRGKSVKVFFIIGVALFLLVATILGAAYLLKLALR